MIRLVTSGCAAALIALVAVWPAQAAADANEAVGWPDLGTAAVVGGGEKDAAVVVAIEKYAEVPVVTGATANGGAFYEWLIDGRKVPSERTKLLVDRKATKEHIEAAIAKAAAQVETGGTLWMVYIGHGATTKDEKDGLWVGADAQKDADSLYARSLRQRDVVAVLERSKAARIVVLVDACFSGRTAANQPLVPNLQPLRLKATSVVDAQRTLLLTAAAADELAGPLPGLGRPAFSYLVLGGLRGWADLDGNGQVTGGELATYARNVLHAIGRTQTPNAEGAVGAVLSSASERGPDLKELALKYSERVEAIVAPKVEQSKVPELAEILKKVAELSGGVEMVSIPGGSFEMRDREDSVTVASFEMDRTGVTVAAYRACVEAGKCPAGQTTGYWSYREQASVTPHCNWGRSGRDNHPMNCVDWNAAKTYCEAQGKRLPTEAEREWAARGGEEGRIYPWGNEAPAGQLCWNGEGNDLGKGQRKSTCPVSSYPAGHSKHGVHDLAGNVWEWTSSAFQAGGRPLRAVRGGHWEYLISSFFGASSGVRRLLWYRSYDVGFRCVRTR